MKTVLSTLLAALLVLSTAGCDRHGRGSFEIDIHISGSWSGTIHDRFCGEGTIYFSFTQIGDHFSGSWRIVFHGTTDPRCRDSATGGELSGPLSGTLSGASFQLTMQRPTGSTGCAFTQPITVDGTWTDDRLAASYGGLSCDGTTSGTVEASR